MSAIWALSSVLFNATSVVASGVSQFVTPNWKSIDYTHFRIIAAYNRLRISIRLPRSFMSIYNASAFADHLPIRIL